MTFSHDDRGVSVAITHVLTVGITAILISGLLLGSSSLLETEQERSTDAALETIGERIANEVASVDQTASTGDTVEVHTSHQRYVTGSQYTVTLEDSACASDRYPLVDSGPCLVLDSRGEDVTVAVPLSVEADVDEGVSVTGGPIVIIHESTGTITLEDGR